MKSRRLLPYMQLPQALALIKRSLKQDKFTTSDHFKQKLVERKLDKREVFKILKSEQLCSITHQKEDRYQLIYEYMMDKDLYIFVDVLSSTASKPVRLVSIYPCYKEMRTKEGKK